jgi:hypothetical protein
MSGPVNLCILCNERPAVLPDRERMGKPIKRVCRECHASRLRGDLVEILKHERVKRELADAGLEDTSINAADSGCEIDNPPPAYNTKPNG